MIVARGPTFASIVVRAIVDDALFGNWPLVRRLVVSGVVDRPEGDAYTRSMVVGIGGVKGYQRLESVYEGLRADPELLDDELWRIFEVEVGAELANAQVLVLQGGKRPDERLRAAREPLDVCARPGCSRQPAPLLYRFSHASLDALSRDLRFVQTWLGTPDVHPSAL